jgi:stage II sporulation protein D
MRVVVFTMAFWAVSIAYGEPPHTDRAGGLYSTQIRFDRANVPMVTLGLVDGKKEVTLSAKGRIRILVDGPGGTEIITEPGRRWRVTLEDVRPAETHWNVRLGAYPSSDLKQIQDARKQWRGRHIPVKSLDMGSVFGFAGKVLSSQSAVLLTEKDYGSQQGASVAAARLSSTYGVDAEAFPRINKRANALISVTDGLMTVRARDVLWLEPTHPDGAITVEAVEFGKGFHWHGREDRQYRGTLYVTVGRTGGLVVGNMVSVETALKGLVPAEMIASAPNEALKAQAVTARGELLAKIGHRHLADPYLVCADVHCQVYAGTKREDDRTSRSIQETHGLVLFNHDRLVDSVYSANCGGHTEHSHTVWKGGPSKTLQGKADGGSSLNFLNNEAVRSWILSPPKTHCSHHAAGSRNFRWDRKVAVDAVRAWMRTHATDPGPIRSLNVMRRGVSGRALQVVLEGANARVDVTGELRIRSMFGSLRSSLFVVDLLRNTDGNVAEFSFHGGGFGHGVGMCQDGAVGMAHKGHSYQDILKQYYTGVFVDRIY